MELIVFMKQLDLESFEEDKNKVNFHYKLLEMLMEEISYRDIQSYLEIEQKLGKVKHV